MWITILVFTKKRLFTKFYFLHIAHIKMTFLLFYQSVELLSAGQWTSLQATNEILSGKWSDLRSISGPLKTTVTIQSLIQQAESVLIEIQSFQRILSSSTKEIKSIGVWIHLIRIPDDCHQAINTASHVGRTRHAVDSGNPGDIA